MTAHWNLDARLRRLIAACAISACCWPFAPVSAQNGPGDHSAATRLDVVDPQTGAHIVQVSGNPGAPIGLSVAVPGLSVLRGLNWAPRVKQAYVTPGSVWNVDGSLLMLYAINDASRTTGSQIIVDAHSFAPLYRPNYPVDVFPNGMKATVRWSEDPAKPTRQYVFEEQRRRIFEYDVSSGQTVRQVLTLPFPANKLGGKGTVAFLGGKEYAAMMGMNGPAGQADAWYYIVNLTDGVVVGQPYKITADDCGAAAPELCKPDYQDSIYFSPDGKYLLFYYLRKASDSKERSWRLFDVNIHASDNVIAAHPLPAPPAKCDTPGFAKNCAHGDPAKGHLPVIFGHPSFVLDQNGRVHLVVDNVSWRNAILPEVPAVNDNGDNPNGYLGAVLDFDPRRNTWRSLTDPCLQRNLPAEAAADYITGSRGSGGKIYATYRAYRSANGAVYKHSNEIVALDLGKPGWSRTIVNHKSDMDACGLDCNVQAIVSPDGKNLLFSSTWGPGNGQQSVVRTFVVENLAALASAGGP